MGAQRFESSSFTVTDRTGQTLGTVTPDSAGSVTCNGGRRIWRNVDLLPADWESLDPYDTLIVPSYTVDGVTSQVGVFAPVSGTAVYQAGWQQPRGVATARAGTLDLTDQTVFLDVQLEDPVSLPVGQAPTPIIEAVLEAYGFLDHDVAWLPATLTEPAVYDRTALDAIDSICEASGAYPLYFTAAGVPTVELVPAPADMVADYTYTIGDGLMAGTPEYPQDWFAPNRWEALGGTDEAPQVGVYDLPADLPGSEASRGFRIIDRFDARGVTDQTTLDAVAQAAAVTAFREAQGIAFDTLADPTHGAWEVLSVDGTLYLQESWTLPLTPGGTMAHEGGRVLV